MSKEKNITNSPDLIHKEISQLAEIFPQFVSEGKVDFEGFKAYLANEKIEGERYHLDRHGKSKAKLIAREPSKATLRPKKAKSKERDTTGNLLIEGDNLEVLKLLQNSYYEKIKCIYIDPPYNTGRNLIYKNNFSIDKDQYEIETGQKDEFGGYLISNSETSGRFHSEWCNMFWMRVRLARNLLSEDGFFVCAMDESEIANTIKICDEIFGEENRLGIVTVVHKPEGRNQEKFFGTSTEYALFYAKNKSSTNFNSVAIDEAVLKTFDKEDEKGRFRLKEFLRIGGGDHNLRKNKPNMWYPIYISKDFQKISLKEIIDGYEVFPITTSGQERTWQTKPETFDEYLKNEEIVAGKDNKGNPTIFQKYYENQVIKTHWIAPKYHAIHQGTNVVSELIGGQYFDFPKPLPLIVDILKLTTDKDSLILDFFAGSGTTGHAVMKLNAEDGGNRKYILVQLPEQIDEKAEAYKAGYRKISEITRDRLDKAGKQIESGDRGFKYLSLSTSNFQELDPIQLKEGETSHEQLLDRIALEYDSFGIKGDRTDEDLLFELFIRYGHPLTTEIVKDHDFPNRYKIDKKTLVSLESQILSSDIQQFVKKYQGNKEIQFICKDEAISDGDRLTLANQFPRFSTL